MKNRIYWSSNGQLDVIFVAGNTSDDELPLDPQAFRLLAPDGSNYAPLSATADPDMPNGMLPPHEGRAISLMFAPPSAVDGFVLTHPDIPGLRFACPLPIITPAPTRPRLTPPPTPRRYAAPPPLVIDPSRAYTATIRTTLGDIVVALDPEAAPLAVNNFVFLARERFYDGLLIHRVVKDFVIQGGDPTGTGTGDPGYRFPNDPVTAPYKVGTVAMANAGPNTNGSQFFICAGARCAATRPDYPIFGRVTAGMEMVYAIAAVPTGTNDRPLQDIRILTVEIAER